MLSSELPAPAADGLHASRALSERIRRAIRDGGGWISFARYMQYALYEPGLGYYAGGATKLGSAGDFVTAPEMGSLFARTLARQLADLLGPDDAVLEFGAGSGALATALLAELERLGIDAPYFILEPSAELAARQRARLPDRVTWLARMPARWRGAIIANEVVDAMPVHAIAWTAEAILERGVTLAGEEFAWCDRTAVGDVLAAARAIMSGPPQDLRYESELGLAGRAWVHSLGSLLDSGVLFIIDYGFTAREYYHPQRSMGSLMCHYRHRAHGDPFLYPGLQDITAHVDFSALVQAGIDAGLELLGFAGQAQFLINCGIADLITQSDAADSVRHAPLAAEANRLLAPSEMGELFKVLALGRGARGTLRGFVQGDRSGRLKDSLLR